MEICDSWIHFEEKCQNVFGYCLPTDDLGCFLILVTWITFDQSIDE